MKRLIKLSLHIFSLTALAALVFTGSIFNKLSTSGKDENDGKGQADGLFSAFIPHAVYADAPSGDGPGVGDSPASEACSGEGDGGGADGSSCGEGSSSGEGG